MLQFQAKPIDREGDPFRRPYVLGLYNGDWISESV
jgi:hypothetical protein